MIKTLLIANRGEIACRITRTARRMGIATVAVYSDADAGSLHVRMADRAVHIGASPATESYLRIDAILDAARATGADAIHPGYGFLAENADFADAVTAAGMAFVGPTGAAMRALGGKAAAKRIAIEARVPVVPGYQGDDQGEALLAAEAARIGYPVMVKAIAGGGGRGMRRVDSATDFAESLASAQREAASSFGDARVLIEKLVVAPRHVEVQVFGDRHGNVVHLFERDCSLQRRNQKVIEEAPAPGMAPELRASICAAAVKLARAVGYEGAGTVEFLVEGGALVASAPWYFIEMNTRLQVEHPVTEAITGLDLVEWQLRVAAGERLPRSQSEITMQGHAVEARLCAEDPAAGFQPSIGRIAVFETPGHEGLRVETGVEAGSAVSPFYDSMIAKLITAAPDRAGALADLADALEETVVAGPRTNAAFLRNLLRRQDVIAGHMDTGLIGRELAALTAHTPHPDSIAAGLEVLLDRDRAETQRSSDPWARADAFMLAGGQPRRLDRPVLIDDHRTTAHLTWKPGGELAVIFAAIPGGWAAVDGHARSVDVILDGGRVLVIDDLVQHTVAWPVYDIDAISEGAANDIVRAPINGRVAKLMVAEGEAVAAGQRVAVVEAMKMEHVLVAPRAGTVARIAVAEGQQVAQGGLVLALADAPGVAA